VQKGKLSLKLLGFVLFVAVFVTGCGSSGEQSAEEDEQSSSGERVELGDTEALLWGEGDYGVVMAHGASYDAASWEDQARQISANGIVALAPEDTSPESLMTSIAYLKEERGIGNVALIGASAGGSAVLRAAEQNPRAANQLMILSATGNVSGLGPEPKLFVASEVEGLAEEVRRMAEEAPGDQNEAFILSDDAHAQAIFQTEEGDLLMQKILKRLEKYG